MDRWLAPIVSGAIDPSETSAAKFDVMHKRRRPECDSLSSPRVLGRRGSRMRRRKFIALLGSSRLAWPLAARTQQGGTVWRIGWIAGSSPEAASGLRRALLQGMLELGYVEGRDFVIEARFADGEYERFPAFAAELVRLNV